MDNINNYFEYNIQSFQSMYYSRSLKMTSFNKSYIINIILYAPIENESDLTLAQWAEWAIYFEKALEEEPRLFWDIYDTNGNNSW